MEHLIKKQNICIDELVALVPEQGNSISVANGHGAHFLLKRLYNDRVNLTRATSNDPFPDDRVEIAIQVRFPEAKKGCQTSATFSVVHNGITDNDKRSMMTIVREVISQLQGALDHACTAVDLSILDNKQMC